MALLHNIASPSARNLTSSVTAMAFPLRLLFITKPRVPRALYVHGDIMNSKIELWDHSSNYIFGELKPNNKIELWDHRNNYIYGELKGTKFELWDHENNYIYGDLKGKKIELWDHRNNYIYGELK